MKRFFSDLSIMTKPTIAVMVVLTTLVGYLLAPAQPDGWSPLVTGVLGVLLAAAASSTLNQVLEIEFDAQMARTNDRPLPAGRVSRAHAIGFGVSCAVLGIGLLVWNNNLLSAGLTLFTLAMYLLVYTPLKRRTSLNTIVGAIPGAMPPVLGWTAAGGSLTTGAFALFAILFLWQLPHFLSIAWLYRDDYRDGGYEMLSLHDEGGQMTARQMMVHCVGLCLVSVIPFLLEMSGWVYVAGVQVAGLLFLASTIAFWLHKTRRAARFVMAASLLYLPVAFGLLALGL